ncbi:MAG TPA: O-antigen ligase family protein [Opitutaceae bacterium]|jgi:O-antigen ligase|nr:O-antigen ligase family protein [Opitutaceae bacterium]
MKPSHAVALLLIPLVTVGSVSLSLLFRRFRDVFFAFMVFGCVLTEHMDVHFISEAWYRGSTRGLEISLIAILALAVLLGCTLGRNADRPRWFWPASLGLLLIYTAYATVSVCVSTPQMFGAFELTKMFETVIVFAGSAAYLRTRREWTILVVFLALAVGLEGAWAIEQKLLKHVDRTPGSLDHENSLSMYLCMVCPLLIAAAHRAWNLKLRLLCGAAVLAGTVALIFTFSRTGIPLFCLTALGATLSCASFVPTPKRLAFAAAVGAVVVGVFAVSWSHIVARYDSASLAEEYEDTHDEGRGVYLRYAAAIVEDRPFGVGLNNWSYYVSRIYGPRLGFRYADYKYLQQIYGTDLDKPSVFDDAYLPAPAHNLCALTLGELGYPGLLLFLLLWLRWFGLALPGVFRGRRTDADLMMAGIFFGICGIFGQSLTEWVYRQTPILFTFYIMMGGLAAIVHARRTHPQEV